jgi:hypothetical protein
MKLLSEFRNHPHQDRSTMRKHSSAHQLKQDDLLEFLYPGLFLIVRGIDL